MNSIVMRLCFLFFLILCTTQTSFGFQRVIKGKVKDSNGIPLSGVNIQVAGDSDIGTQTDFDGEYEINAGRGETLIFSYVGFSDHSVEIGDDNVINVVLEENLESLGEVVLSVGYGAVKKKDLTGAVGIVKGEDIQRQPIGKITNQLQGKVSGVTILGSGQPGESPKINIRGINTFGNNNPLYVVDGIPTNDIDNLNSKDVASIQVLKDGAASIYGSRAANGVIIVETKRGEKGSHGVKVNYDGYFGIQVPKKGNVWNTLNPQEQAELEWLVDDNEGTPHSSELYGNGSEPVLPDYIEPVGLSEGDPAVDPSLYNVNPFYTDAVLAP